MRLHLPGAMRMLTMGATHAGWSEVGVRQFLVSAAAELCFSKQTYKALVTDLATLRLQRQTEEPYMYSPLSVGQRMNLPGSPQHIVQWILDFEKGTDEVYYSTLQRYARAIGTRLASDMFRPLPIFEWREHVTP